MADRVSKEMAKLAYHALEEKKAEDIRIINILMPISNLFLEYRPPAKQCQLFHSIRPLPSIPATTMV